MYEFEKIVMGIGRDFGRIYGNEMKVRTYGFEKTTKDTDQDFDRMYRSEAKDWRVRRKDGSLLDPTEKAYQAPMEVTEQRQERDGSVVGGCIMLTSLVEHVDRDHGMMCSSMPRQVLLVSLVKEGEGDSIRITTELSKERNKMQEGALMVLGSKFDMEKGRAGHNRGQGISLARNIPVKCWDCNEGGLECTKKKGKAGPKRKDGDDEDA